jgi:hypothetical protein
MIQFLLLDPVYAGGGGGGSGGGHQHTSRTVTQQNSTMLSSEHYKHLTEELNKCFDDIELFVRYLESLIEYTKELERDHRRKDRKSTGLFNLHCSLPYFFYSSRFKTNG